MLNGDERKIAQAGEACLRIAPGSDAKRGILLILGIATGGHRCRDGVPLLGIRGLAISVLAL
jgi:hypothetical protein